MASLTSSTRRKSVLPMRTAGFPSVENSFIYTYELDDLFRSDENQDQYCSIPVVIPVVDPRPKEILPPYVVWNPMAQPCPPLEEIGWRIRKLGQRRLRRNSKRSGPQKVKKIQQKGKGKKGKKGKSRATATPLPPCTTKPTRNLPSAAEPSAAEPSAAEPSAAMLSKECTQPLTSNQQSGMKRKRSASSEQEPKAKRVMSETSFNHMVEIIDAVATGVLGPALPSICTNAPTNSHPSRLDSIVQRIYKSINENLQ